MDEPSLRFRAAAGRADLVRLVAALPRSEWSAAARSLGFSSASESPKPRSKREQPGPIDDLSKGGRDQAPPYRPSDLPDLPFWRIAADRHRPPDADTPDGPAWLTRAKPLDALPLSDPTCPRPVQAALVPRSRQARFLRRHLAAPHPGVALDLDRLCRQLAERRLPTRLPRRLRPRSPARVDLVLDLALPLRPFWDDFWQLEAGLGRLLGQRLHVWHSRGSDPGDLVSARDHRPGPPLEGAAALIVLSDGGLYAPGSGRHRRWQDLGHRSAGRQGTAPLLIAPVPPRLADTGLLKGYRVVPWDCGAPLHPLRPGAATGGPYPAPDTDPAGAVLLAAIAHASRVEPPQLRALRLALDGEEVVARTGEQIARIRLVMDIGHEYAVWNHPQVRSNLIACTLAPAYRTAAAAEFRRLPVELQGQVAAQRYSYNRHQSPLIQAEETIAAGPLAPDGALPKALDLVQSLAATLERGAPAAGSELAGYLTHLAERRPELLARNRELATAWAITRREALRRGTQHDIPHGVDLATLDWLLESREESRPAFLAQIGEALGLFPLGTSQPACHLAKVEAAGDYWQVETIAIDGGVDGPDHPTETTAESPQALRLGESLYLDPTVRYRFTIGRRQLDLEAIRRPDWASGLGREPTGLFAELPDGRRLYWMPKGRLVVGEGYETGLDLPHGGWWDAIEYRAWLDAGRRLMRPDWAGRHGVDPSGWWAEFEVKGVVQRMRWLPPGEFLMGSPESEPGRYEDEIQHLVTLTQGFWLADSACTQALWQAVLGETPSHFEGPERPVEQVSWEAVVERFLPALNALVPGLETGLPTEAQWEYACRAGTHTPFSFGATIGTDQVNYDGNYPYAGGAKGEYREQTVEVKALPANDWGLYQMHGNVREWCADWLGYYPREAVVDPLGPPAGRERVLRGGGWINNGGNCRSANRNSNDPGNRHRSIGFRLSRGPSPQPAGSAGAAGVAAGGRAPAAAPAVPARGRQEGGSRVRRAPGTGYRHQSSPAP